jgi:hypothetical protein
MLSALFSSSSDSKKLQLDVVKSFSLDKSTQRIVTELFPRGGFSAISLLSVSDL